MVWQAAATVAPFVFQGVTDYLRHRREKRHTPAAAAQPYVNQIAPMAREAYQPYITRGVEAENQALWAVSEFCGKSLGLFRIYHGTL